MNADKGQAKQLAEQLAHCFEEDDCITVKFKIRLDIITFILLAKKAAGDGMSMDQAIENYLHDGHGHVMGKAKAAC